MLHYFAISINYTISQLVLINQSDVGRGSKKKWLSPSQPLLSFYYFCNQFYIH